MILIFAMAIAARAATLNLTDWVDLFIGTQGPVADSSFNGGNVFNGPALPFGAVKPGIDTTESAKPFPNLQLAHLG